MAGTFSPIFPFLTAYMFGMSAGCLFINLYNDLDEIEKQYQNPSTTDQNHENEYVLIRETPLTDKLVSIAKARRSFYWNYFG